MSDSFSRRSFNTILTTAALSPLALAQEQVKPATPVEAPFTRDYPAPGFNPRWKKPQLNRTMLQDFVIYAHMDLDMTKKLLEKEPLLINGVMDWGAGDWESGLGGASHMARYDIVEFLLSRGARMDIFTMAVMGQLDAIKMLLTLQPGLINAVGPHGFSLHFHAQLAKTGADEMVAYLQTIKKVELKPNPFLKKG